MTQGIACRDRTHEHVVTVRNANFSTFNGGRWTPSDYSEIRCLATGQFWRSKSQLNDSLRDARGDEATRVVEVNRPGYVSKEGAS